MPKSEQAKRMLTDEVRDAAGDEAAGRARERLDRDETRREPQSIRGMIESNMLLLVVTLGLALMVGVIAALAVDSWWILILPLALHGLVSTVVIGMALRMTTQQEKPDPVTEARLEEEGVADPEGELDDLVEKSTRD